MTSATECLAEGFLALGGAYDRKYETAKETAA